MKKFLIPLLMIPMLLVPCGRKIGWHERFYTLLSRNESNRRRGFGDMVYQAVAWEFARSCEREGLDGELLYNALRVESGGAIMAHGSLDERGLGQIREVTARFYHDRHPDSDLFHRGVLLKNRLYDPVNNIKVSAWVLRWSLDQCGESWEDALMIYNGGIRNWKITVKTKLYARRVLYENNRLQ